MRTTFILLVSVLVLQARLLRDPMLDGGLYFKYASVGEGSTCLLALPMVYSFALNDRLSMDAVTTPSMAFSGEDESSIFRVAGTKVRASYVYREFIIGTLGAKIPTGPNQFTGNQLETAGNIGSRQLGFKNSNLFNTLDVCAGLSTCLAFRDIGSGDLSAGLGLSYLFKSPYSPMDGVEGMFDPGDEFNASLAGEYVFMALDRRFTALLDLGFTIYGDDEVEDGPVIETGAKFNWALFGATEIMPKVPVTARLANYRKGANNVDKQGETTKEASDLIFTATAGIPMEVLERVQPYGSLTLAGYEGGGAAGAGDAFIFTAGAGGSCRLRTHMFVRSEIGFDMGSLKAGEDQGVFGIEFSGNLAYKF